MLDYFEFETYRRSYISLCAYNSVVSSFSAGVAVWVVLFVYFPGAVVLGSERLVVWLSVFGILLVFLCNFMIATGHVLWLRVSVGLLVLCLVVMIPSAGFQVGLVTYSISIALPLMGLLSFNSRLHRRFYNDFKEFRTQRISAGVKNAPGTNIYGVKSKSISSNRVSKRETAIKNRCRALEEKIAAQKRRARSKITYPIGALLGISFIGCCSYLIYEAFERGYILLGGRGSPVERYSREGQTGLFWYGIVLYSLLIAMGFAGLRLMYALFKMDNRHDR